MVPKGNRDRYRFSYFLGATSAFRAANVGPMRMADSQDFSDDRLLNGRVTLRQPRQGYRVAIDAVLLAAAVPAKPGERILELGCGVGASSLCLLSRVPEARVSGLELQQELLDLAFWNASANGKEASLQLIAGSVAELPKSLVRESFDHVFFNPPFLAGGNNGRAPEDKQVQLATREGDISLGQWVRAASGLIKPKGSVTAIHRTDRIGDLLAALEPSFGDFRLFPLWPKARRSAKRILVQARKTSRAPLQLCSGLVLHEEDGTFTAAAEAVLRQGLALEIR
jgi:tRNA1(Val) A37 N6-methylase TrmN6